MVLTQEEEDFVRIGIRLLKSRKMLEIKQNERNEFNKNDIELLREEIKSIEDQISSKI